MDIGNIELNNQFQQAVELIERQGHSLFITGKAGTGKSTLLHYLRATTTKETVVLAPTGVAALNVGGQTIHSFFQLPPTLIDPQAIRRRRNTKLLQKLETLIIDEVSMVRADVMDGVDVALRLSRNNLQTPFGGVQVVLCGDLFQLPPIVRDAELQMFFAEQYGGPYFFLAHVFAGLRPYALELTTMYRQQDDTFIRVLNKIREHDLDAELFSLLNRRVIRTNTMPRRDGFITLTTTNEAALRTNKACLEQISAKLYSYPASVTGIFDPAIFPTEKVLELKRGAQVMMVKNDTEKRWVNGTVGMISALSEQNVRVEIAGTSYEVEPETWQNIQYHYHRETNRIEEEVIGTFVQYPLRLAWAITIHKSQGQTFDKVLIDLGRGAFTHGQTYVALSRCRSLEGIVFSRPVTPRDILFDERIHGFAQVFQPAPRELLLGMRCGGQ
ncbi:MAG TPA: AAA family ATPase [Candidatus Binatia bacterium]|nr:AAA family ATPase [Candidatus Binatia bacterium]